MSSLSSPAVRKQLTRALTLLMADARAAKVALPVPFRSSFLGGVGEEAEEDRSSALSMASSSTSTSTSSLLRAALGDDSNDLDASLARLRRLREQVDFLASTPPDVRESLSLWRRLHDEHIGGEDEGELTTLAPSAAAGVLLSSEALAFERGALLLPSVARPPEELELGGGGWSSSSDDDERREEEDSLEEILSAERVSAALDDAALAASDALAGAAAAGDEHDDKNGAAGAGSSVRGLARLLFDGSRASHHHRREGDNERLFVVPRLRPAAVEWLYDGLDPLFPGAVLRKGQKLVLSGGKHGESMRSGGVGAGAPIALAAVASAIARRLGVWNVPVPAEEVAAASKKRSAQRGIGSAAAGLPQSPLLSPSVAARMAARTPAAAPDTGKWLLACPLGEWVWDPATGEVAVSSGGDEEEEEVEKKWPSAGFRRRGSGSRDKNQNNTLLLPGTSSDPRVGWSAMLRACVVAHTRRGDSDAVAAVLPQLLALDGEAPEWEQVLRASEVVAKR